MNAAEFTASTTPCCRELVDAIAESYLFCCTQDSELHFDELWSGIPWPEPTEQWATAAQHQEVEYCVRHVPLAELLADPAMVTRWSKGRLGWLPFRTAALYLMSPKGEIRLKFISQHNWGRILQPNSAMLPPATWWASFLRRHSLAISCAHQVVL